MGYKIKVFDCEEYMERKGNTTVGRRKMCLIKGSHGYIWTDGEYIHEIKDLITDSVRIYGAKKPDDPNSIPLMATMYIVEQLSVLENEMIITETEVKDFFRSPNYNDRLARNFKTFCESLDEIGWEGNIEDLKGEER